jgi:hypothetical protein
LKAPVEAVATTSANANVAAAVLRSKSGVVSRKRIKFSNMKYAIVLLVALVVVSVSAQRPGKREIEENLKGIFDSLSTIIQQVLLPGLIGKREISESELRGFWDIFVNGLGNIVANVILPPVTTAIQTSAELLAQITAGIAIGGLDALTGLTGKREISESELRGLWDSLLTGFGNIVANVILPPVTTAIQTSAELLAQITAGIAIGGLDALTGLTGKRADMSNILLTHIICFQDPGACINNVIKPAVQTAIQTTAGLLAQITAGVAIGGTEALQSILAGLVGK